MTSEVEPFAIVMFNSGEGALLCNRCHVIIATGFGFNDKAHYCDECEEERIKSEIESTYQESRK